MESKVLMWSTYGHELKQYARMDANALPKSVRTSRKAARDIVAWGRSEIIRTCSRVVLTPRANESRKIDNVRARVV
jgi:hypothetical protein